LHPDGNLLSALGDRVASTVGRRDMSGGEQLHDAVDGDVSQPKIVYHPIYGIRRSYEHERSH
jgi:hypothetical protein